MAFENSAEQYKPQEAHQLSTTPLVPTNSEYQHFFKSTAQTGSEPALLDFGQSDIYNDKSIKLAQDVQFPIIPNLVPSPEQLGITKETTLAAVEAAQKIIENWTSQHPLEGQEDTLMQATIASNPKAWEAAQAAFPQLDNVPTALMKAYVRNELAFYNGNDWMDDLAAAAGHLRDRRATLGVSQISPKGVTEFEQKYPQLKAFLERKGYGPGQEEQALLDPSCAPMIVAAKTATIIDDLAGHHIKNPTVVQIAYEYNPDVYSYLEHGQKVYKSLYDSEVKVSQAFHWDQKKEYYPNDPSVTNNSDHVHNVFSWLPKYE
ncbi:MAG: hypothetical protein ACRDHZ_25955 [Ktedonobacteraceae bacterium]